MASEEKGKDSDDVVAEEVTVATGVVEEASIGAEEE